MKNTVKILIALSGILLVSSCDFLNPETDNTRDGSILKQTAYFCGPLNAAYSSLPSSFDLTMDVMTDNAVIRNYAGDYYRCSVGAMSPILNPLNMWTSGYNAIRNVNIFLSKMVMNDTTSYKTPVRFFTLYTDTDIQNNINMFWRLKGEAYGMRAYWMLELMKNYAGIGEDGQALGVPIVGDRILTAGDDMKLPRASFADCIQAILNDCDSALVEGKLPDLYGTANAGDVVYGTAFRGHLCGAAVKTIKAKALMLAASPEFNLSNDKTLWEKAAVAAAEAFTAAGGNKATFSSRDEYYFTQISNTSWSKYDVIFHGGIQTGSNSFESANYPPTMYGNATINVSQNYVDAFTDAQGYPISVSTTYNISKPYDNRDPRLALFVGYDGSSMGGFHTIDLSGDDAYNPVNKTTRSGYYLKKLLRSSVNLTPGTMTYTYRGNVLIGLPEVILNYAEAANEAWGVTGDPNGYGFTAKSALSMILLRDGTKTMTNYLNTVIGTDQSKFRDYVRNQRRIELSFEEQYFYDLRRWYASDSDWKDKINVPVYGVKLVDGAYQKVLLETRQFKSPYPPIQYSEIYNAGLVQNKGWSE